MSTTTLVRRYRTDVPTGHLRPLLAVVLAWAAALTAGCGSGGGGSEPVNLVSVTAHGRVLLGALADATVQVYRVGDYSSPVATATTSTGGSVGEIGRFSFTLTNVPEDAMFLVVATGGLAHDVDEDGVLDGPTFNDGAVHALASVAQLQKESFSMSAVSEVVYQRVRYFLRALYPESYVSDACDAWTTFVLRDSVNGDDVISSDDALAFEPQYEFASTVRPYRPQFASFVERLLEGMPVTEAAFDLSREEIRHEDVVDSTTAVDLVGDLAYVARGYGGLEVWSVADPGAPVRLGGVGAPGYVQSVQVEGSFAYLTSDSAGLVIVNVSDPAAPAFVTSLRPAGAIQDVYVVGDRAFLAGMGEVGPSLFLVDVSTPAEPDVLGECPLDNFPMAVRAVGNVAYLLQFGDVEMVDVSDPENLVSLGRFGLQGGSFRYMDLAPGHLLVASRGILEVFDLSDAASPYLKGSVPLPIQDVNQVKYFDSRAYIAANVEGMAVVDLANPAQPEYLGLLPARGRPYGVDAEHGLLVTADSNGAIATFVAGRPPPSAVVASVARGTSVRAVDAVGSRVYVVTSGPDELVVFDASNPTAPAILGSRALSFGDGRDIVVSGNLAHVAEDDGLCLYDVGNPSAPFFVGSDDRIGPLRGVAVGPGVAFAAAGDDLCAYDVSDPANTRFSTHLTLYETAGGLAFDGSVLFATFGPAGIYTFNATAPKTPVIAGHLAMWGAIDVALHPPYAFVSQRTEGGVGDCLRVVDYSVLAAPDSPASVPLPGGVGEVVRAGDVVYVSAVTGRVNVVDVSLAHAPFHAGAIPVPNWIEDLDVEGEFLFAAQGGPTGALLVLRAAQVDVP